VLVLFASAPACAVLQGVSQPVALLLSSEGQGTHISSLDSRVLRSPASFSAASSARNAALLISILLAGAGLLHQLGVCFLAATTCSG
jgi:hypothetical protein